jgi:anti-sigma factor (TIGR02949 family)
MSHPDRSNGVTRYTCEEMFRRLDDYLDRELGAVETRRVREHLETCAACASEYEFEASVLAEVRSKLQRISAPVELLSKVEALLAAERRRQDGG